MATYMVKVTLSDGTILNAGTFNVPQGGSVEDTDTLAALVETDMLPSITDSSGSILTDQNGTIILRY